MKKLITKFNSLHDVFKATGINRQSIYNCINGISTRSAACKYVWKLIK